jgi:hypothetical protein
MKKITHIKQLKVGDWIRIDTWWSRITEKVLRINNNEITTQKHRVFYLPYLHLFRLPVSEWDGDIPMIPKVTIYKLASRKRNE